jgi:hypothetical protein
MPGYFVLGAPSRAAAPRLSEIFAGKFLDAGCAIGEGVSGTTAGFA